MYKNLVHGITLPYLMIPISNEVPLCRAHTGLQTEPILRLISQELTKLWLFKGQIPTCCHIQPCHGIISHNHEYEVSNRRRSMFLLQYLICQSILGSHRVSVQHSTRHTRQNQAVTSRDENFHPVLVKTAQMWFQNHI